MNLSTGSSLNSKAILIPLSRHDTSGAASTEQLFTIFLKRLLPRRFSAPFMYFQTRDIGGAHYDLSLDLTGSEKDRLEHRRRVLARGTQTYKAFGLSLIS